jgi:hypothetical protein
MPSCLGQLPTFARALEVPVTDLTGQPYAASNPEQDAGQGAVAGICRELLLAEREPRISDAQAVSVSIPALRGRVGDMSAHASRCGKPLIRRTDTIPRWELCDGAFPTRPG